MKGYPLFEDVSNLLLIKNPYIPFPIHASPFYHCFESVILDNMLSLDISVLSIQKCRDMIIGYWFRESSGSFCQISDCIAELYLRESNQLFFSNLIISNGFVSIKTPRKSRGDYGKDICRPNSPTLYQLVHIIFFIIYVEKNHPISFQNILQKLPNSQYFYFDFSYHNANFLNEKIIKFIIYSSPILKLKNELVVHEEDISEPNLSLLEKLISRIDRYSNGHFVDLILDIFNENNPDNQYNSVEQLKEDIVNSRNLFLYHGICGLKVKTFFVPLNISCQIDNPDLLELIFITLYHQHEEITIDNLINQLKNQVYFIGISRKVVGEGERNEIVSILKCHPAIIENDNGFFIIDPLFEGIYYGGLYMSVFYRLAGVGKLFQEFCTNNGDLRVLFSEYKCSFLKYATSNNFSLKRIFRDGKKIKPFKFTYLDIAGTNSEPIIKKAQPQSKLEALLIKCFKDKCGYIVPNCPFRIDQIVQYLDGIILNISEQENICLSSNELSKRIVFEEINWSMYFYNIHHFYYFVGDIKFKKETLLFDSLSDLILYAINVLKTRHPGVTTFPISQVKEICIGLCIKKKLNEKRYHYVSSIAFEHLLTHRELLDKRIKFDQKGNFCLFMETLNFELNPQNKLRPCSLILPELNQESLPSKQPQEIPQVMSIDSSVSNSNNKPLVFKKKTGRKMMSSPMIGIPLGKPKKNIIEDEFSPISEHSSKEKRSKSTPKKQMTLQKYMENSKSTDNDLSNGYCDKSSVRDNSTDSEVIKNRKEDQQKPLNESWEAPNICKYENRSAIELKYQILPKNTLPKFAEVQLPELAERNETLLEALAELKKAKKFSIKAAIDNLYHKYGNGKPIASFVRTVWNTLGYLDTIK